MAILIRPVREQFEHDRVIRALESTLGQRFGVESNVGDQQRASVKAGHDQLFPDLILTTPDSGRKPHAIVEVETGESVNHLEAMAQWVRFGRVRTQFHLYVPVASVEAARRLCTDHHVAPSEVWSFLPLGDQIRFTQVYRDPSLPADARAPADGPTVDIVPVRTRRASEIEAAAESSTHEDPGTPISALRPRDRAAAGKGPVVESALGGAARLVARALKAIRTAPPPAPAPKAGPRKAAAKPPPPKAPAAAITSAPAPSRAASPAAAPPVTSAPAPPVATAPARAAGRAGHAVTPQAPSARKPAAAPAKTSRPVKAAASAKAGRTPTKSSPSRGGSASRSVPKKAARAAPRAGGKTAPRAATGRSAPRASKSPAPPRAAAASRNAAAARPAVKSTAASSRRPVRKAAGPREPRRK